MLANQARQRQLVVMLDVAEALLERDIAGACLQPFEQREVVEYRVAAGLAQQIGQFWIGQHQPAAEGDAVGLVGDARGIEMVQIVEHGLLHQVGMHRRDAVDAVRADEGQLSHPHAAATLFVDQRHRGAEIDVAGAALVGERQMLDVDAVDDLQMPRQQPLEQLDRPGLERFRQQRVVGVGQRGDGDLPGLVPAEIVQVDQDPHQLGDRKARMGVVELRNWPSAERWRLIRSCSEAETKKYSWRSRSSRPAALSSFG